MSGQTHGPWAHPSKPVVSRTLRRWCLLAAGLTCLGLALVIADRAYSKAIHDATWARQVTR